MKNTYILYIVLLFSYFILGQQNNLELLYQWDDENIIGTTWFDNAYNEIWGFVQNGYEFAVIGSTQGTHIFNVTDPLNSTLIATIDGAETGPSLVHRDFHTYNGYLYAVADEGSASTLQIMDLSNLPNSVNVVYDSNDIITRSHNIFIDELNGIMYTCGGRVNNSSNELSILSLADPTNPVFLTEYDTHGYVHDIYVTDHVGYLHCGSNGFHIVDFTDYNTPQTLGSLTSYPQKGYNHSGWLTSDGNTYVFADEDHGYAMKICDVSNPSDITVLTTLLSDVDNQSMAHNLIIKDDLLYVSHYHDGLWIWDISDPSNPVHVADYDTYTPNDHISYRGAWGVYPFLPSGNILVSDMQSGLFVFAPPTNDTTTLEEKEKLIIYPNPCQDQINIITDNVGIQQIELFDVHGKRIIRKETETNNTLISLKGLSKGVYFIQIDNDSKRNQMVIKY